MQNANLEVRIEPLEARIAPATILLRSHDAVVVKAGQLVDVNDAAMAAWAGSGLAVPVKAGDVLVFDRDDDGRYEPAAGEFVLATIAGGRGFVHFTDRANDGAFDPSDITGVVAGNGFSGTFNRTIHGSVVAGLTLDGTFDFFAERNNIAGLTVHGGVDGDILASGSISRVTVDDPVGFSHSGVRSIRAGSAAEGEFSLDGGLTFQPTGSLLPLDRVIGTDISIVRVAGAVEAIYAGDGFGGGRGGSIADVIIGRTNGTNIWAGQALDYSGILPAGAGGVGGSVSKLKVLGAQDGAHISVAGGAGGVGRASSGAGGSVTDLDFQLGAARIGSIVIGGGGGGIAYGVETNGAAGGRGGNVAKVRIEVLQNVDAGTGIYVAGGDGGEGGLFFAEAVTREKEVKVVDPDGFGFHYEYVTVLVSPAIHRAGAGGAGGAVSDVAIRVLAGDAISEAEVEVRGGDGGLAAGKAGGAGGAVARMLVAGASQLQVYGGNGGATPDGVGGVGGAVSTLSLECPSFARVSVFGGSGGEGGLGGGHGGNIVGLKAIGERLLNFGVFAGSGGGAGSSNLAGGGGAGGSVASVAVRVSSVEDFAVISGNGGGGGARVIQHPVTAVETVRGGAGGAAGSVSKITLEARDDISPSIASVLGGDGGNGNQERPGGAGGAVKEVVLRGFASAFIRGGAGGEGTNWTGGGGAGGSVELIELRGGASGGRGLSITGGNGGHGGAAGRGGAGGAIAEVRARLDGGAVEFYGGNGGAGNSVEIYGSEGEVTRVLRGAGGLGGPISDVAITATGVDRPVYQFFAGGGGGSGYGAVGAAGGAIARLQVRHAGDLNVFIATGGLGGDSPNARGGRGGDVALLAVDVLGQIVTSAGVLGGDAGLGGTQGEGGWLRGVRVKAGTPFAFAHNGGSGEPNGRESGVAAQP